MVMPLSHSEYHAIFLTKEKGQSGGYIFRKSSMASLLGLEFDLSGDIMTKDEGHCLNQERKQRPKMLFAVIQD